jgi:hypothetical protein
LIYGSSNVYSNAYFSQTLTLAVAGAGPEYITDEYVFQGGTLEESTFSGRVFYWDSANSIMELTEYTGNPTSAALNGQISGAYKYINSTINPDLKNRSGEILYIDNVEPITRSSDQTENIRIVIRY